MPSKALLHIAKVTTEARGASEWGIEFGEPQVDLQRLRTWKERVVEKLTGGLAQLSQQRAINYIQGRATLVDPHTIRVDGANGDVKTLSFDNAILATGSRPACLPGVPFDNECILDSTAALEIRKLPRNMLVVGGGYIGLELGSVYAALGTEISLVEMTSGLLPGVDRDLVSVLARKLNRDFKSLNLNTSVSEVTKGDTGVQVTLSGPDNNLSVQQFDAVLVSVGRVPNSNIDGLDQTRVEVDTRGFVAVDTQCRTAEPSLFAIGDLVGEPMLAHKAFHEGRVAVDALAGDDVKFEPMAIPAVVFTDPELAWCGLTETQASRENRQVVVSRFPWAASGRAITIDQPSGITKLVIDPDTEQVLGMGVAGAGAGELIAEGVMAIEMGATPFDIKMSIHPHPTLSETVLEAAEVFLGQSTHVYRPKHK
jgi:dihydrolipoamide dehydrogenase